MAQHRAQQMALRARTLQELMDEFCKLRQDTVWAQNPDRLLRSGLSHTCMHCGSEVIPRIGTPIGQYHDLHHDVPAAFKAALAECPFFWWLCSKLVDSATPIEQLRRTRISFKLHGRNAVTADLDLVAVVLFTHSYSWSPAQFDVAYDTHPMDSGIYWRLDPELHVQSVTLKKMRQWLISCLKSHSICASRRNHSSFQRPTWLLDLSLPDQESVRLVRPDQVAIEPYTTLSYCWGGEQRVQTTLATLAAHQAGIRMQSLPQTFKDAIFVSRGLGIQMLWIDSLCIVQDDAPSKATEIDKMSDYYSNATVTLIAAAAATCEEGFLRHKSDLFSNSGPFNFPAPDNTTIKLGLSRQNISEPIALRAWTLQEDLLSTRAFSFGPDRINWSCSQVVYGSSSMAPTRSWIHSTHRGLGEPDVQALASLAKLDSPSVDALSDFADASLLRHPEDALKHWAEIIRDYIKRNLSNPNDRLPAISGVAREFSALFPRPSPEQGPKYLAGLWNCEWLLYQLLWEPTRHKSLKTNPGLAPSWSWVGVSSIEPSYFEWRGRPPLEKCTARVITSSCLLEYEGVPFGVVQGGSITIEAQVHVCHFGRVGDELIVRQDPMRSGELNQDRLLFLVDFFGGSAVAKTCPRGLALTVRADGKYVRFGTWYSSKSMASVTKIVEIV